MSQQMTSQNSATNNAAPALVAIKAHIAALRAEEAAAVRIRAQIDAKRAEIEAAQSGIPALGDLMDQRQNLLAAIALGEKSESELTDFDQKCAAGIQAHAEAQQRCKAVTDEGAQLIGGLQRRLGECESRIAEMRRRDNGLLTAYLLEQAEIAGEAYARAADALQKHYLRLVSLDGVLKLRNLRSAGVTGAFTPQITLPAFMVSACAGRVNKNYPEVIFNDFLAYNSGKTDVDLKALMAEMLANGVSLAGQL